MTYPTWLEFQWLISWHKHNTRVWSEQEWFVSAWRLVGTRMIRNKSLGLAFVDLWISQASLLLFVFSGGLQRKRVVSSRVGRRPSLPVLSCGGVWWWCIPCLSRSSRRVWFLHFPIVGVGSMVWRSLSPALSFRHLLVVALRWKRIGSVESGKVLALQSIFLLASSKVTSPEEVCPTCLIALYGR